jgi:hypothetical protein
VKIITREQWLEKAIGLIAPKLFEPNGLKVPRVRVSVGFTGARQEMKTLGACWSPKASSDGVAQIFITPRLDDSLEVLAVLVHELIHAAIGNDKGHGPAFRKAALSIGLEGKMTATIAGPALIEHLNAFVKRLGPIPHAALNANKSGRKKQGTRLIKVFCPDTEYTARTTRSWLDAFGAPICPCCERKMSVEIKEGEEEDEN